MQAMQVDEALEHADEWIKGVTMYEGAQGWRVACATLAAEVRKLREENDKFRAFAQKMLEGWPEYFGDVDGFTIQAAAVECGLLVGETRHEPCGEDCNCASYHGDMSGGVTCYRRTASLMGPNVMSIEKIRCMPTRRPARKTCIPLFS